MALARRNKAEGGEDLALRLQLRPSRRVYQEQEQEQGAGVALGGVKPAVLRQAVEVTRRLEKEEQEKEKQEQEQGGLRWTLAMRTHDGDDVSRSTF